MRWSGGDATGQSWEDSWVGVTWLTHDLRREAREMEVELYRTDARRRDSRRGLQQTGLGVQAPRTTQRGRATARGLSKRGRRGGGRCLIAAGLRRDREGLRA